MKFFEDNRKKLWENTIRTCLKVHRSIFFANLIRTLGENFGANLIQKKKKNKNCKINVFLVYRGIKNIVPERWVDENVTLYLFIFSKSPAADVFRTQ